MATFFIDTKKSQAFFNHRTGTRNKHSNVRIQQYDSNVTSRIYLK